jgi:hypothetical protein
MSSAILYVAIVAIWACVLIPRWLRRGTSGTVPGEVTRGAPGEGSDTARGEGSGAAPMVPGAAHAGPSPAANPDSSERAVATPPDPAAQYPSEDDKSMAEVAHEPLSREESRRRMLAARRRLLIMMMALEMAAGALTILRLAALWVVIPPTMMLAGYLLLLREAAAADRERAAHEAEAAEARAHARAHAREKARARAKAATAAPAAPPTAPAEPRSEDYEDLGHGRDFAPGLAGKYTASNAHVIDLAERAEYKRAVGD